MDTRILEKIGFTKGEVRVYLALLDLGNVSSGPIIKKSGIAGSKIYGILERLKVKGLVSETIKVKTKYFYANSPKRILDFIKNKERELIVEQLEFKKILPNLIVKQRSKIEEQEVKSYLGYEGIKTFYIEMAESLTKSDEYLGFAFPDKAIGNKSVIQLFDRFHEKRARNGGVSKILLNSKGKLNKSRFSKRIHKLYQFRKTNILFPAGISIFKDMVVTFSWGNPPRYNSSQRLCKRQRFDIYICSPRSSQVLCL